MEYTDEESQQAEGRLDDHSVKLPVDDHSVKLPDDDHPLTTDHPRQHEDDLWHNFSVQDALAVLQPGCKAHT